MARNLQVRDLDEDLVLRLALSGELEPSFEELAAKLRSMTARRKQTPAELLQREGRAERCPDSRSRWDVG